MELKLRKYIYLVLFPLSQQHVCSSTCIPLFLSNDEDGLFEALKEKSYLWNIAPPTTSANTCCQGCSFNLQSVPAWNLQM